MKDYLHCLPLTYSDCCSTIKRTNTTPCSFLYLPFLIELKLFQVAANLVPFFKNNIRMTFVLIICSTCFILKKTALELFNFKMTAFDI